ncbi:plasmid transfer ATPase TraJ [Pseudomonas savastanoi]|uniref:plasmid transfer ATPase TraJ n=1 Tax=Pseudomonas savastanoi TaxID=29438 RepID=UPI0001F6FFF9|nr:plasmid transfer ATPase TraJ [Pseudomonas savastanoi]EFW77691.1 plasmid transfer ATPase TraJ [Pseudomonas savastanoi pv. glycinea str. B076]
MIHPQFEPFNFEGDLSPHNFKRFLKLCSDRNVSDVLVQGGDYIWVELHGRQLRGSVSTVKQGQLSVLIAAVWSPEIESLIKQGDEGVDRPLEITGSDIGLDRGMSLRFRTNFVQARIANLDEAFSITMRVIPVDLPDITKMEIEPDLFEELFPEEGLVIVCGPTGSGKTTLLAGTYGHIGIKMPDRKVITFDDPIEFVLGGPHWKGPQPAQSQIGRDIKDFPKAMRNAVRRKPSIIGIGEARDRVSIEAMVEASLSGHTCYATMHTKSVAETINRAIQTYPPEQQSGIASRLAGALRVIIVQRLLKTTDGKRTAIREYLVFDREFRSDMQSLPYNEWALLIRTKLEDAEATLDDKAWKLYQDGRILQDEFVGVAGMKEFRRRSLSAQEN